MMQSHLPSPARLGLTASSPSLPPNPTPLNPTSSPPHGNLAANAAATAAPTLTTSPSLLPLLPPLPRAQSLLHLISSLASNLFELSPNRAAWISAYRGSLPAFLPSASSSAPLPSPISSTKDAMPLLTTLQTQLFEAVAELQETLDLKDARARLAHEARAKDAALLAFAKKLREAHHVLDRLVDDYADYRRDPKRPRGAAAADDPEPVSEGDFGASLHSRLNLDDVLTYAHRISYTTFAPPEHGAGLPLRGALPPAPQENEMRMSQLYQFADLDVGVPKKPLEAKEGITAEVEAAPLFEPTPPLEEPPQPLMLPITLPPGLLKEMPKPPPGWKPGDPITLPLDGILPGIRGEEPQATVLQPLIAVKPVAPTGPEPIQVKPVQLDFESSSSDEYSSDVGSSEEDDED
ncbi:mediator of RNA polymerase II transcription subunit 4-like [Phragmites australis]|uniref:mediator of RNA polymerase II transcription subunit 4-like n=1 Tax=Phragmites australis TaxID=29695 RepID=UPI002D79BA56|nr:mediator of RNA polymerase II transcription subunit 4-like [Phragmites australis]